MNKWTKSILIALGITLVYGVLAYFIKGSATPVTHRGHFVVKISPKENALTGNLTVMDKVVEILKSRITNAGSAVELKALNDQMIDLDISKMKDTGQTARLLTGNSRMEFREMYTIAELSNVLTKADELLGYKTGTEVKVVSSDTSRIDSSLVKFSDTDPPAPEVEQKSLWQYLQPIQPYTESSGSTRYPAQIGHVLKKDTAFVSGELQRVEIMNKLPIDVKFLYGVPENKNKETEYIPLYAVRAYPGKPAFLDNDDIMKAKADYGMNGEPEINFEFNPVAARKWEKMTGENIGKPIAIIIDGRVISAPNVLSAISGGAAVISGGFTIMEAQDLSLQLGTTSMPAYATIVKQEITRETRPLVPGNPLLYLLVLLVAGGLSYLILSLLTNK